MAVVYVRDQAVIFTATLNDTAPAIHGPFAEGANYDVIVSGCDAYIKHASEEILSITPGIDESYRQTQGSLTWRVKGGDYLGALAPSGRSGKIEIYKVLNTD